MTGRTVIELAEWERREFPGLVLEDADRTAWASVANQRVEIQEMRQGLAVSAKSWVGVLQLPTLEVKVRPKLSGDHLHLARMIDFAHGVEALQRETGANKIDDSGDSLLDLLALLFSEAAERVVRKGLISGYIEREDDLGVVRGRILPDRQVMRRFGLVDRIACRFDEFEHDVVENKVVLAAICSTARWVRSVDVRRRLDRLRHVFESVCDLADCDLGLARASLSYDRLNSYYRTTHELAWLLLDGLGVSDLLSGGRQSFAFFLDMNRLFERFVRVWLERILPLSAYGVRSQSQHTSIIWNVTDGESYSTVIPDLLIEAFASGDMTAVDAKYKRYNLGANEADIYQAFLYAFTLGKSAANRPRKAMLVHPVESAGHQRTELHVRAGQGAPAAEIVVFGLPIAAAIDEVMTARGLGPIGAAMMAEFENSASQEKRAS